MKVSSNLIRFLGIEEGKKDKVYLDSGGVPTIGIGHKLTKSERTSGKIIIRYPNSIPSLPPKTILIKDGLTDSQISDLLLSDLIEVEKAVNLAVTVKLQQYEYDSLCSMCFNIGNSAFVNSTLVKLLNKGDYKSVPSQMRRWIHDNGEEVEGLKNRREAEILLWENKFNG